jgi:glycogen operon protein
LNSSSDRLLNLWGYHPVAFFAPKASLAANRSAGGAVREFKQLVKALHAAGIEIILDLVFNHTGEAGRDGQTTSFRGIDNATYYIVDPAGAYRDYTGCGNTLNCNHPVVRDLILDCLHYWVTEMHVDGFRFDLASVLGRGLDGSVLPEPPLVERIAADPILARTKLIAEAWDATGLYQVGSFPAWGRWAEWNGRFRDDVRRFLKGDPGLAATIATRMSGSPDLYRNDGRSAHHSINFVTSHDGFTLADLVSYDRKHNDANGEASRDGINENDSWNCGCEGPDAPDEVVALRRRQMRNALAMLLLAQGVPMLLAGDESGRTQGGNNNAYCQDSPISWVQWHHDECADALRAFVARLLALRRGYPQLRHANFLDAVQWHSPLVEWHGPVPHNPDWSHDSRLVAFSLAAAEGAGALFIAMNVSSEPASITLPNAAGAWRLLIDTRSEMGSGVISESEITPDPIAPVAIDGRCVLVFGTEPITI